MRSKLPRMKKSMATKLHLLGQDVEGDVYAVECGTGKPHKYTRVKEGESIEADAAIGKFTPTDDGLCEFTTGEEVFCAPEARTKTSKGPSKVATEEYRNGWDRIFN